MICDDDIFRFIQNLIECRPGADLCPDLLEATTQPTIQEGMDFCYLQVTTGPSLM